MSFWHFNSLYRNFKSDQLFGVCGLRKKINCSENLLDTDNWVEPSRLDAIYYEDYLYLRGTERISRDEFNSHIKKISSKEKTDQLIKKFIKTIKVFLLVMSRKPN